MMPGRMADANHDGAVSREEFLADQPDPDQAPARFEKFDANHVSVATSRSGYSTCRK